MRKVLVLLLVIFMPAVSLAQVEHYPIEAERNPIDESIIDEVIEQIVDEDLTLESPCDCLYEANNGKGVPSIFVIETNSAYEISEPCSSECGGTCKFYYRFQGERVGPEREGKCRNLVGCS